MSTLTELMLDVARLMGTVREGTATDGSETTLIDTLLDEPADYFTKGTLWILTGDNEGLCTIVKTFAENTITIDSGLVAVDDLDVEIPIAAGDEYAVATPEFPKHKLKQAALSALKHNPILLTDDNLVVTANTKEYTLPDGVSNIRRVEVATEASAPYSFTPNMSWREWNGKLIFDNEPTDTGKIIRLWYEGFHGVIDEDEEILSSADVEWVKWSSVAFLYRDLITRINKDNPTDLDLLNEAKIQEAEAKRNANKHALRSMPRDPKVTVW
jgi:hypothetical protein